MKRRSDIRISFPRLGMSRENLKILSVVLTCFGILMLFYFLRNVDNGVSAYFLYIGAVTLGLGNALGFITVDDHSTIAHFILILFITIFFLSIMHDIRFGVLQGSDITQEYVSSDITVRDGFWLLSRQGSGERYFTAVSISFFPAIVTKVTGLDLMTVFQWVMRIVTSILPVIIFVTVKDTFENTKLAALAALIFTQFYFNFNYLNFAVRQGVAEIFLVLTIYLLVRIQKTKGNPLAYEILLPISLFGLVITHYTMNYWSVVTFVGIFVLCFMVSALPKRVLSLLRMRDLKMERTIVTGLCLVFFFVATLVWIYFTNLTPFLTDVHNELNLLSPQGATTSPVSQTSWILSNPAGLYATIWFDLSAVLIPIGFLYALFRVRKQMRHMPWFGGCLITLAMVAFWTVAGSRMLGIYFDRVYTIGLPFFTSFIAISLFLLDGKLRRKSIIVFGFLLLNIPFNMLVPSYQRYVLYNQEKLVSAEVAVTQRNIRLPEFATSQWMDHYVGQNLTIYTDFYETWFYSEYHGFIGRGEQPPNNSTNKYYVLHYYNLVYGLWQSITSGSTLAKVEDFPVDRVLQDSSVLYSNGDVAIIDKNVPSN